MPSRRRRRRTVTTATNTETRNDNNDESVLEPAVAKVIQPVRVTPTFSDCQGRGARRRPDNFEDLPSISRDSWDFVNDDTVPDGYFTRRVIRQEYEELTVTDDIEEEFVYDYDLLRALIRRRAFSILPPVNAPSTREQLINLWIDWQQDQVEQRAEVVAKMNNKKDTALNFKLMSGLRSDLVCNETYESVTKFVHEVQDFEDRHEVDAKVTYTEITSPKRLHEDMLRDWKAEDRGDFPATLVGFKRWLYRRYVREQSAEDLLDKLMQLRQNRGERLMDFWRMVLRARRALSREINLVLRLVGDCQTRRVSDAELYAHIRDRLWPEDYTFIKQNAAVKVKNWRTLNDAIIALADKYQPHDKKNMILHGVVQESNAKSLLNDSKDDTETTRESNIAGDTAGNCWNCGQPGHYARSCNVNANLNSNSNANDAYQRGYRAAMNHARQNRNRKRGYGRGNGRRGFNKRNFRDRGRGRRGRGRGRGFTRGRGRGRGNNFANKRRNERQGQTPMPTNNTRNCWNCGSPKHIASQCMQQFNAQRVRKNQNKEQQRRRQKRYGYQKQKQHQSLMLNLNENSYETIDSFSRSLSKGVNPEYFGASTGKQTQYQPMYKRRKTNNSNSSSPTKPNRMERVEFRKYTKNDRFMHMTVQRHGKLIAYFDGGATIDIIDRRIAAKTPELITKCKAFGVHTAGGMMLCRSYVPLNIKIGEQIKHVQWYILDTVDLPHRFMLSRGTLETFGYTDRIVKIDDAVGDSEFRHDQPEIYDEAVTHGPWHDRLLLSNGTVCVSNKSAQRPVVRPDFPDEEDDSKSEMDISDQTRGQPSQTRKRRVTFADDDKIIITRRVVSNNNQRATRTNENENVYEAQRAQRDRYIDISREGTSLPPREANRSNVTHSQCPQ